MCLILNKIVVFLGNREGEEFILDIKSNVCYSIGCFSFLELRIFLGKE